MTGPVWQGLLSLLALAICIVLAFSAVGALVSGTMPPYRQSAGNDTYTEKITGQYLLELSSAQPDTLFIFGSSELRTTEIPTHPANFFAGPYLGAAAVVFDGDAHPAAVLGFLWRRGDSFCL